MQDFRKLYVWQKSHQSVLAVYAANAAFPESERYGLTSQIRRATASIPANIAEGRGRETNSELHRFLYVAMGSASESDYHLLLARDLDMLALTDYQCLLTGIGEIKRMLTGLIQCLNAEN